VPTPLATPPPGCVWFTGRVLDADGAPLAGAAVDVVAIRRGALSGADGRFTLLLPAGRHHVRIWRMDHAPVERDIDLQAGIASPVLEVQLAARDLKLAPVVVNATRRPPSGAQEPGHYVVSPETLDRQIGGFEDVMRSVQALPGVGTASDFHGEFFVRGAGPHANTVTLDGIPIFFPYHILGFNSIFNPGLVERAEFYAGGAPAAFGGTTGGVLAVTSRGASPAPYHADFGVSSLAGHVHAAGGGPERGWALSLRRSYHDKLVQLVDRSNTSEIPSFYDAMLRMRWMPQPRHLLVGGLLLAGDGLSIPDPEATALRHDLIDASGGHTDLDSGPDRLSLDNRLVLGSLQWRALLGPRAYLETVAGYTPQKLSFALDGETTQSIDIRTGSFSLRQDLAWQQGTHRMRFGYQGYRSDTRGFVSAYAALLDLRETNSALNLSDQKERYAVSLDRVRNDIAVYAQDEWALAGGRVGLAPGLRYEYDTMTGQQLLSPRLALEIQPETDWRLRGTWGLYHALHNTPMEIQPTSNGRPLRAERDREYTLGVIRRWRTGLQLDVTGYSKDFTDLVYEAEPAYYTNGGVGHSSGVETSVALRPPGSPMHVQLQYTWAETRQRDPQAWRRRWSEDPVTHQRVWGPVYEEPYWYSPYQDQRHHLGLDAGLALGAWELGTHLQVASGLPYTPIESVERGPDGKTYGIVGRKGSARLPAYQRLDFRVTRNFHGQGLQWRVYAEVLNATAAENVYLYRWNRDYTQQYSVTMLPVLPTLGIEASF
jgi:hypothetical protein